MANLNLVFDFILESCKYHPGVPVFHDAYKGWSCCNKKSVDFTEFLNFKGCTLSEHSNEVCLDLNLKKIKFKLFFIETTRAS